MLWDEFMMTRLASLMNIFKITFNGKTIFDTILNISCRGSFMSAIEPFFIIRSELEPIIFTFSLKKTARGAAERTLGSFD